MQRASHQGDGEAVGHASAACGPFPSFPAADAYYTLPPDEAALRPLEGKSIGQPDGPTTWGGASPSKAVRSCPQQGGGPPLSSPAPLPACSRSRYLGSSPAPSPSHHAPVSSRSPPPPPSPSPPPPADPHLDPGTLQGLMQMLEPKLPARRFHAEDITQVWDLNVIDVE